MSTGLTNVVKNLERWAERKQAKAESLAKNWAGRLGGEAKLKINAKWEDRTSHARQGLFGTVIKERNEITIVLAHTVRYGIWLELARDGKYAVLKPVMDRAIPEIRLSYERLWRE